MRGFSRVCKLTVYTMKPETKFAAGNPQYFDPINNGVAITQLKIAFNLEKTLEQHPNKADVTITNLNEASRKLFAKLPLSVKLEAGFDGEFRHLFGGDVRYSSSKPTADASYETKLELADGGRAISGARVNKSYLSGSSPLQIIRDAAHSMNLELPRNVEADLAKRPRFAGGYVAFGSSADDLTRLLAPYGYTWSIQNGRLQVLRDEEISTSFELEFSTKTGLHKSPEIGEPPKDGKPPLWKIKSQLYPQVHPGSRIRVISDAIVGSFKVEKVNHKGDSMKDEFATELEARPL